MHVRQLNLLFAARTVCPDAREAELAIRRDACDVGRYLLHRLEVLAAALQQLERLKGCADHCTMARLNP